MKKEHQFAKSIIALNVLFFMALTPITICQLMQNIYSYTFPVTSSTPKILAIFNFFFYISVYIGLFNNSLPFIVNLTVNRLFRKEMNAFVGDFIYFLKYFKRRKVTVNETTTKY